MSFVFREWPWIFVIARYLFGHDSSQTNHWTASHQEPPRHVPRGPWPWSAPTRAAACVLAIASLTTAFAASSASIDHSAVLVPNRMSTPAFSRKPYRTTTTPPAVPAAAFRAASADQPKSRAQDDARALALRAAPGRPSSTNQMLVHRCFGVGLVLTLMLGAHAIAPKQARSCCSPTQHRAGVLVAASPGRIFGQLVSGLLVNTKIRGRDQRHIWLRAIALIHPHTRLLLMVIAATAAVAIWLRPGWTHECVPLSMFGTTLALCRAVVAVALVASGASATTLAIAYEVYRGAAEERKDASLCEELLAAAASSAAYEESVEHRLAELRRRGVESANWHVDERLSDATVAVFYNHHEQVCGRRWSQRSFSESAVPLALRSATLPPSADLEERGSNLTRAARRRRLSRLGQPRRLVEQPASHRARRSGELALLPALPRHSPRRASQVRAMHRRAPLRRPTRCRSLASTRCRSLAAFECTRRQVRAVHKHSPHGPLARRHRRRLCGTQARTAVDDVQPRDVGQGLPRAGACSPLSHRPDGGPHQQPRGAAPRRSHRDDAAGQASAAQRGRARRRPHLLRNRFSRLAAELAPGDG